MAKPADKTPTSFEDRRVMRLKVFLERNAMSRVEFYRRLQRQKLGEPDTALLLPKITQLGTRTYGVRYDHEREWQEARVILVEAA
jgi:hypothetical protein